MRRLATAPRVRRGQPDSLGDGDRISHAAVALMKKAVANLSEDDIIAISA
jgi:hypothetical protein